MDFDDTPAEAALRHEVRDVLDRHTDDAAMRWESAPDGTGFELARRWQRTLLDAGLVGITWPAEFGGQGGSPIEAAIVEQELRRAGAGRIVNGIAVGMVGPTIIAHGTDAQRSAYLARILSADDIWCQLFSEPAAGSDVAGIQTRAHAAAEGWTVRGQNVWTTMAHEARFGLLLARTDPDSPRHGGLTAFVIDMRQPGVSVRPLRDMTGECHFNEVFFDDAVIPAAGLLGDLGGGWRVAITTLMNERVSIAGAGAELGMSIEALLELARPRLDLLDGRGAALRRRLGRAVVDTLATRYTGYRRVTELSRGETPGPEGSMGKITGVALYRDIVTLGMEVLGDSVHTAAEDTPEAEWRRKLLGFPGWAIAGGTTEILKNIIGERVLGLPKDSIAAR